MTKWEYGQSKISTTTKALEASKSKDKEGFIIEKLNELGDQGWEVCHLSSKANTTIAYLKRPKTVIDGMAMEPLRKGKKPSEPNKALVVEAVVQGFTADMTFGNQKSVMVRINIPEYGIKEDFTVPYTIPISRAAQNPNVVPQMSMIQAHVEQHVREIMEKFNSKDGVEKYDEIKFV